MALRRGRKPAGAFSPGEAQFILASMIRDGRINSAELAQYRNALEEEKRSLLERLRSLGAGEIAGAALGAAAAVAAPPVARAIAKAGRRARTVTAEQLAGRKLQGQYLGRIRQIPKGRRAEFSRIAKEQGREAAIKAMDAAIGANGKPARKRAKK